MKKNTFFAFCRKYRSALFFNFANTTTFVFLYLIFLSARIRRLKFDVFEKYPDLVREEQILLIKNARSELIVHGVFISLAIMLLLYFPLLLVYFKINFKESFFECARKIKDEKEKTGENSGAEEIGL